MNRPARSASTGFTLVEVMVALAIVAIALPALLFTLYQQVDTTGYLRDKSMAQLVAVNKLTEFRLLTQARRELSAGRDAGTAAMAGRDWFWNLEVSATQLPQFFKVAVSVGLDEQSAAAGNALYSLSAFLSADMRMDTTVLEEGGDTGANDDSGEPDASNDANGDGQTSDNGNPASTQPRRATDNQAGAAENE